MRGKKCTEPLSELRNALAPANAPPAPVPASAEPLGKQGSFTSTAARSPSFSDETTESRLASSLVASDTSAATMSSSSMATTPSTATVHTAVASASPSTESVSTLVKTPPTGVHRGDTLDRALDVLASQDLSVPPESACGRSMGHKDGWMSKYKPLQNIQNHVEPYNIFELIYHIYSYKMII